MGLRNTRAGVAPGAPDPFVVLTDEANIVSDASISSRFHVTLTGNRTLDNPANLKDGEEYIWCIDQDATGSRTLAYGSAFKFPGGTAPTLTAAANAHDMIRGVCVEDEIHCEALTADIK